LPTLSVARHQPATIKPPSLPQKPGSYFPALDGLRAIAFLLVFSQHYLGLPWGWAGVDVFFVLSGFLITGILFDTRAAPRRVSNFYLRRTLRIFPLYYGLILLLLALDPIYRWKWDSTWLAWPAYLGNFARCFVSTTLNTPIRGMSNGFLASANHPKLGLNFGHFWSLCVEEQFYLVWPWMVFWIRDRRRLIYLCGAAVVLCPLLRIFASHTLPQVMLDAEVLYRATPFRVDALLLGGLVALLQRGGHGKTMLSMARLTFAALSVGGLAWFAHGVHARYASGSYVYPTWMFTWGLLVVDVISACLIVMALDPEATTYRLLNLAPLRLLGRISYGAYVFHDIFHGRYIQMTEHILSVAHIPGTYLKFETAVLAFVCTLVLAWASFQWFETPFIRLKTRFSK
jgi:peptidoglycan/LPS O-acetylase OafA/YrhL